MRLPRPELILLWTGLALGPGHRGWGQSGGYQAPPEVAAHCHLVPHRSKHPSVRLLLLVFLEVPLFLGMLGAVLWVHRPLRSSESRSVAMDPVPGNTAPSAGWK